MKSSARAAAAPTTALLVWLLCVFGCSAPEQVEQQPTVIFVVLDTVRADHLSLCGYERPTSPQLEKLAQREGVFSTCRAYAPGDWTLPSHASFFTGLGVTRHGARISRDGPVLAHMNVTPLADSWSTLAEQLGERGYQSLAVSGNPVLTEDSGLMQGFDHTYAGTVFGQLRGRLLIDRTLELLDSEVDRDGGPLFLFVNIADAHGPWLPVPETLGWIPKQPSLLIDLTRKRSTYSRLLQGKLDEEQFAAARTRYLNAYDYGTFRADRTLGILLRNLEAEGWLDGRYRLVITSDHGEYLAERGLVGHGGSLLEINNRIPLFYFDSESEAISLPDPVSGLTAFYLARDGRMASPPSPLAVAFPNLQIERNLDEEVPGYDKTSVGLWEGDQKWVWADGTLERYDLDADPKELSPESIDPELAPPALQVALQELADLAAQPTEVNEELLEKLRALGYVD
jgi:hypothetical protein